MNKFCYDMVSLICVTDKTLLQNGERKMAMNLNQLYYFVALAQAEHYTQAAETLAIAQPTLSHAIALLEEELGAKLFEKRGRNVVLTKSGRLFWEYASESLQILEAGIKKTKAMNGENSGMIDLAFIYTLGIEFLPKLVREFYQENPGLDVQFRFTVGNTQEIIKGLKEEKYDLAFCSRKEKEKNVLFLPVAEEKLVVVVAKEHPLAAKDEIDLSETEPYPQIFFTKSSGLRPTIEKLFQTAEVVPQIAYEIEEDSAMAGLAAKNFGIAVMPDIPVLKHLDIKKLKITRPVIERYIYMAQIRDRYQPPAVKKFAAYVQKRQKCPGNISNYGFE